MDSDWADGSGHQLEIVLGSCEDMCPVEERRKRLDEADVHKLELPYSAVQHGHESEFQATMIKKFQRSSADHDLLISSMLRTPAVLLRTVAYIESSVANKYHEGVDPRFNEAPSKLFVYLFIWDRYRMVAKDFTLQFGAAALSEVWLECHERMARWFVFMDHSMKSEDDYLGGHAQQNGEQLNNLLKTLQMYYGKVSNTNVRKGNEAEFIAYFILFQIENPGEVTKFLQKLSPALLRKAEIQFAMKVWVSIRTENYVLFFHLLAKSANILQASLMHRYVDSVRYKALKKLLKSVCLGSKTYNFSTEELAKLMLFESLEETIAFVEHCGLKSVDGGAFILFESVNLDSLLPRDKNDLPIYPKTKHMEKTIHGKATLRNQGDKMMHIMDICRGSATNSIILPEFVPTGSTPAKLLNKKDLMKRMSDKIAREKSQISESVAAVPTPVAAAQPPAEKLGKAANNNNKSLNAAASEFVPGVGFKAQPPPAKVAAPAPIVPSKAVAAFPPPAPATAPFGKLAQDVKFGNSTANPFGGAPSATNSASFAAPNAAANPFAAAGFGTTPAAPIKPAPAFQPAPAVVSAVSAPAFGLATPAFPSTSFPSAPSDAVDNNLAKSNLDFLNKRKESQAPSKMKLPDSLLTTRETPRVSPKNNNANKDFSTTTIKPTKIFETPAVSRTQATPESVDTISKFRDVATRGSDKSSLSVGGALFGAESAKKGAATPTTKQKDVSMPSSAPRAIRQESYDAISAHFPDKIDDARVKELTKQVKQQHKRRVLSTFFHCLYGKYEQNKQKVERFVTKRCFRAWLRVMRLSNQARDAFLESVSSIQIIPPEDDEQVEGDFFGGSGRGSGRGNRRHSRGGGSGSKRPPIRAYSARSLQANPHLRDGGASDNFLQGAYFLSSSSPHHSLAKLGFSLFQSQTQHLRQLSRLLPIPETLSTNLPIDDSQQTTVANRIMTSFASGKRLEAGEYWQGDLYLKVALFGVNCASEGGLFINQTDCPVSAMMRAALSNEEGYFHNFNFTHNKTEKALTFDEKAFLLQAYQTVGSSNSFGGEPLVQSPQAFLLSKASHTLTSSSQLRLSVVDVPGIKSFHDDVNAANFSAVDGSRGLVLLFSNFHENFLNFPVDIQALEAALREGKPIVFVFSVFHEHFVVSKSNVVQEWTGLPSSHTREHVVDPVVATIVDNVMHSFRQKIGPSLRTVLATAVAKTLVLHASFNDGFIQKKTLSSEDMAENVVRIPLPIFELQHSMYLQAAVSCMDKALLWLAQQAAPVPVVEGRRLLPLLREKVFARPFDACMPSADKVKISLANVSFWLFAQYLGQAMERLEGLQHELHVKRANLAESVRISPSFPTREWLQRSADQAVQGIQRSLFHVDEQFYGFLPVTWRDGKVLQTSLDVIQQALAMLQSVRSEIPKTGELLSSKAVLQLCQQIDAIAEKIPGAGNGKRKQQQEVASGNTLHAMMTCLFAFYASRLHQDQIFALDMSTFDHIHGNMLTVMRNVLRAWLQRIMDCNQLSGEEMLFSLYLHDDDLLHALEQKHPKTIATTITWPALENVDTSNRKLQSRGGEVTPLLYADVVRRGKRAKDEQGEEPAKRAKKNALAIEEARENEELQQKQQQKQQQRQAELQALVDSIRQEKTASQKVLHFLHKKIVG